MLEELKAQWIDLGADLYGSREKAAYEFDRLDRLIRERAAKQRAEEREAAQARRIEREKTQYRGARVVASTCGRCGTQHPGEC